MAEPDWDSVARTGYEAYLRATRFMNLPFGPRPTWEEMSAPIRKAWVESSIAVALAASKPGRPDPTGGRSPPLYELDEDERRALMQHLEAAVERLLPECSRFAVLVLDGPDLMTHVSRADSPAIARGLRDFAARVELAGQS
jgi:hypothetical protein